MFGILRKRNGNPPAPRRAVDGGDVWATYSSLDVEARYLTVLVASIDAQINDLQARREAFAARLGELERDLIDLEIYLSGHSGNGAHQSEE